MRLTLALLALSVAGAAQAEPLWGDAGGCTRGQGDGVESDMLVILSPDRVRFYESECVFSAAKAQSNGSWTLTSQCTGEGETWTEVFRVTPLPAQGMARLRLTDEDGITWELSRCG